jgi:PhnB protein
MTQLCPYLHFSGNCREAMTFYQACLGGELKMQTVGESPMVGQMPPEMHKNILHSSLTTDSFLLPVEKLDTRWKRYSFEHLVNLPTNLE